MREKLIRQETPQIQPGHHYYSYLQKKTNKMGNKYLD